MGRRWLMLAAALLVGCSRASNGVVEHDPPPKTDTNFERLPLVLAGIQDSAEVSLYEGLPGEFWDPQLREEELRRKKTIRLHGYPFYEEPLAFRGADAGRLSALMSAKKSFNRFRGPKECGGYHPEYCAQWKTGGDETRALISLECGEVKMFGPRGELHCDLTPDAAKALKQLLSFYRKNRPASESSP
jgi:hypothetical protein